MTRDEALKKLKNNRGSILELEFFINNIYDSFENKINNKMREQEKQIKQGFCSDETQDKNYEIYERIDILKSLL